MVSHPLIRVQFTDGCSIGPAVCRSTPTLEEDMELIGIICVAAIAVGAYFFVKRKKKDVAP